MFYSLVPLLKRTIVLEEERRRTAALESKAENEKPDTLGTLHPHIDGCSEPGVHSSGTENKTTSKPYIDGLIVACISCDRALYVQNAPSDSRVRLGLHPSNRDTFLLTVCSTCEEKEKFVYSRITNQVYPYPHDMPRMISESLVCDWWLYKALEKKYNVKVYKGEEFKVVVRRRDFFRKIEHDETRIDELVVRRGANEGDAVLNFGWRRDTFLGVADH